MKIFETEGMKIEMRQLQIIGIRNVNACIIQMQINGSMTILNMMRALIS